jgi:Arf-GAP/coiled-coil/ANK repeat/PH domain-containing protein
MCCWWSGSEGLGEAYDGDIAFASALETFGGGHDDPISVAVGGFPLAACFSLTYLPTCAYADPCIFISLLITTCDCTGPVMTKFTIALREIGTYKEVLRSQVVTAALLLRLCTSVWNAHSASLILNSCILWAISPMVMQVEHMLNDRLTQFVSIDLQDVKVCLFFPRETM